MPKTPAQESGPELRAALIRIKCDCGAWEAGVAVAAAYPGTPSTEILESLAQYPAEDLHAQWSTNEKVALDVAIGASFAGRRALAAMKHVTSSTSDFMSHLILLIRLQQWERVIKASGIKLA